MASAVSHRLSLHAKVFYSTTALSCASQIGMTIVTIWLSTSSSTSASAIARYVQPIAISAAVLDVLGLISIVTATVLYLRRVSRKAVAICSGLMVVVSLPAYIFTIYILARIWNGSVEGSRSANEVHRLALAGVVTWAVAVMTTIIFYTIVLWPQPQHEQQIEQYGLPSKTAAQANSISRSVSIKMAILNLPQPPARTHLKPQQPANPTSTLPTSPSQASSLYYQPTQSVKPVTSRSRLIHATSFTTSRSSRSSKETTRHHARDNSDFENWDTSSVDATMSALYSNSNVGNAAAASSANRRTRLETIPGSRPASPAKPLDGPFPCEDPESPTEARSNYSPDLPTLNIPKRPSFPRQVSRGRDPYNPQQQQDQSHIHPLFRTASTSPRPVASPGTIITASPYAGQVYFSPKQSSPPPPALPPQSSARRGRKDSVTKGSSSAGSTPEKDREAAAAADEMNAGGSVGGERMRKLDLVGGG